MVDLRFISASAGYFFEAIKPEYTLAVTPRGPRETLVDPGVQCHFRQGQLLSWEWDIAAERLSLAGIGYDEDTRHRYSAYDTELQQKLEGWSDERRKEVEDRLGAFCGPNSHILIDKPRLKPPWPSYDLVKHRGPKSVAQQIAEKVRDDGYEPHSVLNYERENLNRPEVIAAVEAVEAELVPAEEEEILA